MLPSSHQLFARHLNDAGAHSPLAAPPAELSPLNNSSGAVHQPQLRPQLHGARRHRQGPQARRVLVAAGDHDGRGAHVRLPHGAAADSLCRCLYVAEFSRCMGRRIGRAAAEGAAAAARPSPSAAAWRGHATARLRPALLMICFSSFPCRRRSCRRRESRARVERRSAGDSLTRNHSGQRRRPPAAGDDHTRRSGDPGRGVRALRTCCSRPWRGGGARRRPRAVWWKAIQRTTLSHSATAIFFC